MIVAETFFAMATECEVMKCVAQFINHPGIVCGDINGIIPTTYKKENVPKDK